LNASDFGALVAAALDPSRGADRGEVELVRHLRGPIMDRLCVRIGEQHHWIEKAHAVDDGYATAQAAPRLAAWRRALEGRAELREHALPIAVAPLCHVWAVPGPALVSDRVFGPGWRPERGGTRFRTLGAALAALHALRPSSEVTRGLPRFGQLVPQVLSVIDAHADGELGVEEERLRAAIGRRSVVAGRAIAAAARVRDPDDAVLLHGRFSLASVLPAPDGASVILGGVDPWLGPRELDIGYLLGELVEHAAVAPDEDRFDEAAELLDGYLAGSRLGGDGGERIGDFVVFRICDHLLRLTRRFGFLERHVDAVLDGVVRVLPEFERRVLRSEAS
jgi:hypothetical protein